jgi:hypothetical protein
MPDIVVYVLVGIMALVYVLAALARRFPDVGWLSHFQFQRPYDARRDRHLDAAWLPKAEGQVKQNPFREALAEARKDWRTFREALPELPPEQKARQKRRSNVYAGVQLILLGIALPFGYHVLSMMLLFSSVSRTENVLLVVASATCVLLGIIAIARSGKG